MGGWRGIAEGNGITPRLERRPPVDRFSHCIDNTAKPAWVRIDHRITLGDFRLAPDPDSVKRPERHQKRPVITEADHLPLHPAAIAGTEVDTAADTQAPLDAADFNQQPLYRGHAAIILRCRKTADF